MDISEDPVFELRKFVRFVKDNHNIDLTDIYRGFIIKSGDAKEVCPKLLFSIIEDELRVSHQLMSSRFRYQYIADARKIFAHHLQPYLIPKRIGKLLMQDRSTVICAQNRYYELYAGDKSFKEKADRVNNALKSVIN